MTVVRSCMCLSVCLEIFNRPSYLVLSSLVSKDGRQQMIILLRQVMAVNWKYSYKIATSDAACKAKQADPYAFYSCI